MPRPSRPFLSLPLLLACSAPVPAAPVITLAPAIDTVQTTYAEVTEGAWLGNDRWAVVAPMDLTVGIVDPAAGTVRPLGGDRSKELKHPSGVFVLADTLYVTDWGLRRTTLWTLDGRLVRAIPAADAVRGALPRARDGQSRFYLELRPRPGPDGSGNRDSAAVVRTDPEFRTADTVAQLAPLDIAEVMGDGGRRFERRVFSGADRWGGLPDGAVWVARVYHNRVDWRGPDGQWKEGDPLPDRVLEVTRYDRELFFQKFPPELRHTAEQLPFAPVKPPFENGFTAPDGAVWLEKSRAPADSTRQYHLVGREGHLTRQIRVLGSGRIVAVGPAAALVAERGPGGARLLTFSVPITGGSLP